jgi:osmotically-inducible protein OsmY
MDSVARNEIPLRARAENLLRRTSYRALQHIRCEHHEGVLTLRGRVSSFYLKQIAQEVVSRLEGIELVDNRIEVES